MHEPQLAQSVARVESSHALYYAAAPEGKGFALCRDDDNKPRRWTSFIDAYRFANDAQGIVISKEVSYGHPPGVMLNSSDKDEILL